MAPQSRATYGHRVFPVALIICYTFAILACLTIRPLWLDEVLELIGTTTPSLEAMLRWVPANVGGVPLGYLTQRPFVLAGGPFAFWARLPSALFSAAACGSLMVLCRELKIPPSTTILAAGIFMIVPAQFRYATEARPYSEALCFMLVAMVAIAKWERMPSLRIISLLLLATVAGLYTQPFTALAVCGLCAWSALTGFRRGDGWRAAVPLTCLFVSGLAFLPWYRLATHQWDASIQRSGYPKFHWTFAVGMDAFKGISGGSFLCSVAFLVLVAIGIRASAVSVRGPLLSAALFVLVGALAIDSFRDYFFAARQFLFAVPSLSILAAAGFASALQKSKLAGGVIGAIFLVAALTNDVAMQVNAKEDWPSAANMLAQVSRDGYCFDIPGSDRGGVMLYSVFVPSLSSALCSDPPDRLSVALVSNLATSPAALNAAEEKLRSLGFAVRKTMAVGGTTVKLEVR